MAAPEGLGGRDGRVGGEGEKVRVRVSPWGGARQLGALVLDLGAEDALRGLFRVELDEHRALEVLAVLLPVERSRIEQREKGAGGGEGSVVMEEM